MNENRTTFLDRQQFQLLLVLLVAGLLGESVLVLFNNSFRAAPIFVFLLILGVGSTLLWGILRGGVVALVIITIWVFTKQAIGIWMGVHTTANLIELAVLLALFWYSAWFGTKLNALLDNYEETTQRLEKFHLEDRHVGLIKGFVGELRVQEEEERSQRYKRPFSLVLIHCLPVEEVSWDGGEMTALMRTIANTVKSTSRRIDIPFLLDASTIALLLPETGMEGSNKVLQNLMQRMDETRFLHPQKGLLALEDRTQIRYGFAAYHADGKDPSNIIDAAKRSLKQNLENLSNKGFQNTVVEWVEVNGENSSVPNASGSRENS